MKIFMLNSLYHPHVMGGAERVVQSLAESMVERGHQVAVATVSPGRGVRTENANGVTVHYLGVPQALWPYEPDANPKHLKLMWKGLDALKVGMASGLDGLLDRERPDVVHSHNLPGFSVGAWQKAKARHLPLVHTLHDYSLLCARSSMFRSENCREQCAACRLYASSKRRSSDLVDAVAAVSRFVLERHLQHGFFARSAQREVIFNGYEIRSPVPDARKAAMPLQLGFLGRLQPSKGIEWLLQRLTDLPSEQWEIWVAGAGEAGYVAELQRRYGSPRVRFLGFVRPEELFARIDVLLVPSLWQEPFGMTIIEAYAHGIPVIAANRGGSPEIVDHGHTGFLIDPDSPHSLLTAIRSVREDPELVTRMRRNVLEKAKEFSTRQMVDRYLALYERARGVPLPDA
jgi:glycosyltransferase involved in cell wall biosynthesis